MYLDITITLCLILLIIIAFQNGSRSDMQYQLMVNMRWDLCKINTNIKKLVVCSDDKKMQKVKDKIDEIEELLYEKEKMHEIGEVISQGDIGRKDSSVTPENI